MIYTPPLSSIKRYVRQGVCISAQGADGLDLSINEAVSSMQLNDWQESGDDPFLPVHDYDRPLPHGDAYRAVYGYDADARTERVACGAVAYVIKLPADATSAVACTVRSIVATIVGDRYLADADNETAPYKSGGAIVTAHLSDSPTPPAWSSVLAASGATVCQVVTSEMGVDDKGRPAVVQISPNDRAAVTESTTLSISSSAQKYLCIVVRVADYSYRRGAWYEGGAMLDRASLSITLSRDVTDDNIGLPLLFARPQVADGVQYSFSGSFFWGTTFPSPFVEYYSASLFHRHDLGYWRGTKQQYDVLAGQRFADPAYSGRDVELAKVGQYWGHQSQNIRSNLIFESDDINNYKVGLSKVATSGWSDAGAPDFAPVNIGVAIGYPIYATGRYNKILLIGNIENSNNIICGIDIYVSDDLPPFIAMSGDDMAPWGAGYVNLFGNRFASTRSPKHPSKLFTGIAKDIQINTTISTSEAWAFTPWNIRKVGSAVIDSSVASNLVIDFDAPVSATKPWCLLISSYVIDFCAESVPDKDAYPHIKIPISGWRIV